ncbi:aminoglycoside phosphotransferase family protein [Flavobacterium sp. WC2509]|uniref:aminoglycoside phosphotransferase family protein n=1 Tax=Flavobacterium sp. WC2509 TaxID=3461406 RepID=UPI00404443A9
MKTIFKEIEKHNDIKVIKSVKIEQGVMTDKYLLTVKKGDENIEKKVILRIYPDGRESILKFEPEVFKKAKEAGVKVPNYISSSIENKDAKSNYILYDYIEGNTLNSIYSSLTDDSKNRIVEDIVDNLLKLSSISCEDFGPLQTNLLGSFSTWKLFIENAYNEGKKQIRKYNKNNDVEKILNDFKDNISFKNLYHSDKKALIWLDFYPENIIINDRNEFAGFIDFEEMISGDLAMSIGYLYAREGKSDFFNRIITKLNTKININIDQEIIDKYAILRLFRIAPYLKNDLPTGKKRESFFCVFKGLFEIYQSFEIKKKSKMRDYFVFTLGLRKFGFEKQKKYTAFNLTFFSLLIVGLFIYIFTFNLNDNIRHTQYWNNNENIKLNFKKSPSWFIYEKDTLISSEFINDNMKQELIGLAPDSIKSDNSYFKEVNVLAYKSQKSDQNQLPWLLIASGLISVIGVNIRSLWDFVGNASYKDDLDVDRWWPWYFLRPTIGFLAGVIFYFLYYGGMMELNTNKLSSSRLYFLLAISGIIGFGLNDFIDRLRNISKAIFGIENNKKN